MEYEEKIDGKEVEWNGGSGGKESSVRMELNDGVGQE